MSLETVASAGRVRGYWPLNETSGDAIEPFNGLNGTDATGVGSGTGLIYPKARLFVASNSDHFVIDDTAALNMPSSGEMTIFGHAKLNTIPAGAYQTFAKWALPNGICYAVQVVRLSPTTAQWRLLIGNAAGDNTGATISDTDVVATTGVWYFIRAEINEILPRTRIQVNELSAYNTSTTPSWTLVDGGADLWIGSDEATGNDFDGYLQGWGLIDGSLTSSEISELYNGGAGFDLAQYAPIIERQLAVTCREPIVVAELDQDQCRLIYAESPCGASLSTTGVRKCYNTRETCQDPDNYDSSPSIVDDAAIPQDISSAGAQEATFDVSTEEPLPGGIAFSTDGTKLYVVGENQDKVRQYPLTTPWDISSAGSVAASLDVSTEDTAPQSVAFKTDGSKIYIVGTQNDQVREYALSTPWSIATAGAVAASFSVAGEDTSPQGLAFSEDGLTMYIVGGTSDQVHQYPLSTAWDISSAGAVEASFDVSGEDTDPQDLFFAQQGTKLLIIGTQNDTVRQYPLSTAWDISTAGAVEASFDVSGEESPQPSGVALSRDGTKLYITGTSGFVRQYPLTGAVAGIARDATGAVDVEDAGSVEANFSVATEETAPIALKFKPDGTVVYVAGSTDDKIIEYPLSTAWDISTVGSAGDEWGDGSTNLTGGFFFKPDGTKVFVCGISFGGTEVVHEHAISTPWDLTTVSTTPTAILVVTSEDTNPQGIFFRDDGLKLYMVGLVSDKVHQYPLSVAWDLSTAGAVEATLDVSTEDGTPTGIFFRSDGAKLYMIGTTTDKVYQYPLSTPWDVSSAGADESSFLVSGEDTLPRDVFFKPDGTKLYIVGTSSQKVHQYPIALQEGLIDGATHVRSRPTGFSQALEFDGVNDSVEVLDINDRYGFTGTSAFSVEFILDPDTVSNAFATLIDKTYTNVSGEQGWRIYLRLSDTSLVFERILNGAADEAAAPYTLLEEHFWSCVYDGTDIILYEDGVEVDRSASSKSLTAAGESLLIGNTIIGGGVSPYDGRLDDLRIWSDARTATEVNARMVLPISGLEANLVSYFPFDTDPLPVATRTLRFTKPYTGADRDLYMIPLLTDVSSAPTRLNPGGGSKDRSVLGDRASIDASFKDAPGSDRIVDKYRAERISGTAQTDESGYQPLDRGTFWSKWRARNLYFQNRRLRILEGYVGEALRDMQTREYFIDKMRGPDGDGKVTIRAKDVLKLADDERAQAPVATPGELTATLAVGTTTNFQATGALIADYPEEPGLVRINDEIIEYQTRTQETANNVKFSTLTRGARGTTAAEHDAEDRVQRCLEFVDAYPWELAETLLTQYGNVPSDFIPSADWAAEGEVWLTQFQLSAVISEPTSVTTLLSEITQQAQFFIWWDEYSQTIKLKALRPPTEDPVALNDTNHLLAGMTSLNERPEQRLSQVWIFFNQKDPTKSLDEESNYARVRIRADLEAEGDAQYGESRILKIFSRWLDTSGKVIQVAKRVLDRYRDNPRLLKIRVDAKDRASVRVGDLCDITTRTIVDERGVEAALRWHILSAVENPPGEAVTLELQESEFGGRFAFYMESTAPIFTAATEAEKKSGAWYAEDDGEMADGSEGYQLQ